MSSIAISVEALSKRYRIGQRRASDEGFRHVLEDAIRAPLRWLRNGKGAVRDDEDFWALQDMNFEVKTGEVMGIIGRNGAGKSTLLKILSRITEPTTGRVAIEGRVASLLEVGTGFHPELTGRENIFLNGAILGMTRAEIRRKFDEIVDFSEVEKFLDTPVKHYSSGMYVRLAFAVAAHLEPEILIIDEVLAVGDAQFQKKCLGKMRDVSGHGRTVLFVSHNMGAVLSLCQSACWLNRGRVVKLGTARDVVHDYLTEAGPNRANLIPLGSLSRNSGGDGRLRVQSIEWLSELPLRHAQTVRARIEFVTNSPVDDLVIGIGFANLEGTRLLTYDSDFFTDTRPSLRSPGTYSVDISIPELPLAPGIYNLDIGGKSADSHSLDYLPSAAQIEVIPGPTTPGAIIVPGGGVRLSGAWNWQLD